jgi:HEAT repeat protein
MNSQFSSIAAMFLVCASVLCLAAACGSPPAKEPTAQDIAGAIAMLHSPDKAGRDEAMVQLQRLANIPDRRSSTIRAVIAVLDEPATPYRTWYAAADVLGAMQATEAVSALIRHMDYKEGLNEYPEGRRATTWALLQIGEPAVSELSAVLANGEISSREKAADALGLIQGEHAEQALLRARQSEKEQSVLNSIDDALRGIEVARAERQEITVPVKVARHCLSTDSDRFKAKPIRTLFLDERPTPVDETLCHVEALEVSEPGNWWLVRTTPSGVESSLIGVNSFSGYSIGDFRPSPDGQYLAVLSSAEGAPYIQVVDLVEFVRKKTMKLVGELPLGLGTIHLRGWNGRALQVASSLFIGQRERLELITPSEEAFSWDVITGAVTPQSAALHDPVRYYCGFVATQNQYQRSTAANALGRLRDQTAVPCMEAALSKFPDDPDLKMVLQQLLAR